MDDVRDKPYLSHDDVVALNFIKSPCRYIFRRHYRTGLRSHVLEVLDPEDIVREKKGIAIDGLTWFPKAKPKRMLRVFRTRFENLAAALKEIERVKVVLTYLRAHQLAMSNEFLVAYSRGGRYEPLLCGLQEFVTGEILDPWSPMDADHLSELLGRMMSPEEKGCGQAPAARICSVRNAAAAFIENIKKMAHEAGHVPDLAGVGNLLLTPTGDIKLVDINNISRVRFDRIVRIDDRGYPVCDKSIQALSLLEMKMLERNVDMKEPLYKTFLEPERMKEVKAIEKAFHLSLGGATYPAG